LDFGLFSFLNFEFSIFGFGKSKIQNLKSKIETIQNPQSKIA